MEERPGGHGLHDDRDEEPGHDDDQRHHVPAVHQRRDAPVDGDPDQPRPGQGRDVADDDEHQGPGHLAAVGPQQAGEQPPGAPAQQRGQLAGDQVDVLGGDAAPGLIGHRVTAWAGTSPISSV